ncbi:MAG: DUF2887 domain-containing protein [Desulfobacteraceae bacterium]|nr:DUF2887 domain-containing protein [Desulfobacteraceae bacterium]
MKTDALFYELFQFDPRSLFELMGIDVDGEYIFESITVKTTEKRLDGFLKRTDGKGPNFFVEIQGYYEEYFYWRFFREICTWHEQNKTSTPFVAVALFVDKKHNPGKCPLSCVRPNRLIRGNLETCLRKIKGKAGALTVLKPLVLSRRDKLTEHVRQWKEDIDDLKLPEDKTDFLLELLEYTVLQRFPELTLKEIQKMIELTPLEETVAGKELIQIGWDKGEKKGEKKGKEETAVNLMKIGIDVKIISQATGLSQKKIKQLALGQSRKS